MHRSLQLTAFLALASVRPALAQEGGLLDINEGLMVWTIIIFLIVLAVLYEAAYPHILGAVEAREATAEVLEAKVAESGAWRATARKVSTLSAMSSGTASITRSAVPTVCARF